MYSLVLLRGLPGSGKSTLAKVLDENGKYPVLSVDDYFTNSETGVYDFIFTENHLAYKDCEARTRRYMQNKTEKIFVDNTFTLEWELEPYFKLASEFNYQIFVVTIEHRHSGENIHGISNEQLTKMAEKYKVRLM